MKTINAIIIHRVLRSASYGKTSGKARIAFVRNAIALRPLAEKFDADVKVATEQLTPAGFADIEAKGRAEGAPLADQQAYADAFNARAVAVDEAMRLFLESDSDVTVFPLPEADIADFLESNAQLKMEEMEAVMTGLMAAPEEDGEGTEEKKEE